MTNQITNSNHQIKFDLEERTSNFGKEIINFSKGIKINPINNPIINQLVRSGTSVGANYCEANESNSKRDFIHKISIAKKEAKETMYWLGLISSAEPTKENDAKQLRKEAHELVLIFSSIIKNKK
ncbi:MAG TPA: four helix bundle protein [Patescibacteria group bacterium]|nr:four helix bundle protein [Patescibacteria group bacterium]